MGFSNSSGFSFNLVFCFSYFLCSRKIVHCFHSRVNTQTVFPIVSFRTNTITRYRAYFSLILSNPNGLFKVFYLWLRIMFLKICYLSIWWLVNTNNMVINAIICYENYEKGCIYYRKRIIGQSIIKWSVTHSSFPQPWDTLSLAIHGKAMNSSGTNLCLVALS